MAAPDTTNQLLLPAGAEPGSWWLLFMRGEYPPIDHKLACWYDSQWVFMGKRLPCSAASMWKADYRLADPHGAAAAVKVLEAWIKNTDKSLQPTWELYRDYLDDLLWVVLHWLGSDGEGGSCWPRAEGTHPTSALSAAFDTVKAWEARNG